MGVDLLTSTVDMLCRSLAWHLEKRRMTLSYWNFEKIALVQCEGKIGGGAEVNVRRWDS